MSTSVNLLDKPPSWRRFPGVEEPSQPADWQAWFQLHGPRLLLSARRWTSSYSDAQDIVQEAFVRYWRRQRRLGADALPLLLTSIRRAALDHGRRRSRRSARESRVQEDLPTVPAPSAVLDGGEALDERRRALEAALRGLPPEQREVVILKIWGELTFEEIARRLSEAHDVLLQALESAEKG